MVKNVWISQKRQEPLGYLRIGAEVKSEGPTMSEHQLSRPTVEKSEVLEMLLRVTGGGLTVGLLIVLPALKILGLA
jgi:hypothetical protein